MNQSWTGEPTSWQDFKLKFSGSKPGRETEDGQSAPGPHADYSEFWRFYGRFRMAKCYVQTEFDGISEKTATGYSTLIGIAHAYSALEQLQKAITESPAIPAGDACPTPSACSGESGHACDEYTVRVRSQAVTAWYRGNGRAHDVFLKHLDAKMAKRLIRDLKGLRDAGEDATPVAKAIRHLTFHGILTPSPMGIRTADLTLLQSFKTEILDATDACFTAWVAAHEPKAAQELLTGQGV